MWKHSHCIIMCMSADTYNTSDHDYFESSMIVFCILLSTGSLSETQEIDPNIVSLIGGLAGSRSGL